MPAKRKSTEALAARRPRCEAEPLNPVLLWSCYQMRDGVQVLHELRIGNLKGFAGDHIVRLSPMTLIYGPNSAGKSALIQALALLGQSVPVTASEALATPPLTFRGRFVDLGDFESVVNGHSRAKSLSLGLTHELTERPGRTLRNGWQDQEPRELGFDVSFQGRGGALKSTRLTYFTPADRHLDESFSGHLDTSDNSSWYEPVGSEGLRKLVRSLVASLPKRPPARSRGKSSARGQILPPSFPAAYDAVRQQRLALAGFLPNPAPRTHSAKDPTTGDDAALGILLQLWQSTVADRLQETRSVLNTIRYLGPLRESPKRIEVRPPSGTRFVGAGGEDTSFLLYRDPQITTEVNTWLKRLEVPYEIRVERLTPRGLSTVGEVLALVLRDSRTHTDVSPKDVGFGISQVLPVVTQCLASTREVLLIEQPEIHLHPRLQANLADLMILSVSDPRHNQVIAETHSEALLLRLQRRIREGKIDPELVRVLYVGNSQGVGSWIEEIPLGERGEFLEEWPHGFFEERLDEITLP